MQQITTASNHWSIEHSEAPEQSKPITFETLEEFARLHAQAFIQRVLEEEVSALLGREKSERRTADPEQQTQQPTGYRNGHGRQRRLSTGLGTVTVRRPRVRGLSEKFESGVLPLFRRRTDGIGQVLPALYLHGLAEGDFEKALRGLLGQGAALSASSIARMKAVFDQEYQQWKQRPIKQEMVYVWVDGIYVKAGLEKEKAALLVVMGACRDGTKVILAVEAGHRASIASWSSILRDLKMRGMNTPRLVIGDGALGIWGALANVFPEAREQRCWNHRLLNLVDRVAKKDQSMAKVLLTSMMYANTRSDAERIRDAFCDWCKTRGYQKAGELIHEDWDRLMAYYSFPKEHWQHLRTTNPVESPFATVRLRTTAAKRYKKVENATAVIWKVLMLAQTSFRRLNASHLLAEVASGVIYVDGVRAARKEVEPQEFQRAA